MKFFACLFTLAFISVTLVMADKTTDMKNGLLGSSYGGGSYAAPPCPKSYLFSCQPNVAPVPCAAGGGGYAGAYSEYVPQYALPQYAQYQQYAPQY
ncbi:vitelline membrane protein Vm26Aa-like [Eupeodes corollae]|uniref:vitelline membrane protein Vm26Aa-like n=1 Tax=Eupeodes corollae TaxID=290404 RepID=UPI002493552E|nr:vitelline membrane protein Vm26Aa-like [Eupeodes corollae]